MSYVLSPTRCALGELPGVVLVGEPSAGGSGLAATHEIGGGAVRMRLSTMVSFRPDGKLLDGRGVTPDLLVRPAPEDFVGVGDRVLSAALERLSGAAPEP